MQLSVCPIVNNKPSSFAFCIHTNLRSLVKKTDQPTGLLGHGKCRAIKSSPFMVGGGGGGGDVLGDGRSWTAKNPDSGHEFVGKHHKKPSAIIDGHFLGDVHHIQKNFRLRHPKINNLISYRPCSPSHATNPQRSLAAAPRTCRHPTPLAYQPHTTQPAPTTLSCCLDRTISHNRRQNNRFATSTFFEGKNKKVEPATSRHGVVQRRWVERRRILGFGRGW